MGEPGTGKSMLLEIVARSLRRAGGQVANVSLTGIDLREFLWLIAAELGLNPDGRDDVFRLWREILDRLSENRYQQMETVLLLDDAHEASREVLEHVARLGQLDHGANSRLTIVLARRRGGRPALESRLLELAELRIDVEPWEEPDTLGYLTWSLAQAGRKLPTFSDDAMLRLHALSDGIPRRVNQLANLSLVAGAARQVPLIDSEIVASIHHELGLIESAA